MDKQILYIEDEESDVLLLRHAFNRIGMPDPFTVVTNGEEAIEYLAGTGKYSDRQRFPIPRLVLLDLNLPRKNGFEFLLWRRGSPEARRIPVVVFTSSTNPGDVEHAYELGAAAYLTKEPDPAAWVDRIRALVEFWLKQNTPLPALQPQELKRAA